MIPSKDQDRATQLFLQHYQYVAQVAFHAAPSKSLQDDIVHDTFIQFVKNPEKWDLEQDIRPLLKTITKNVAMKYWRDRIRTMPEFVVELMEHIRVNFPSVPEDDTTMEDRLFALNLCMKKLTPRNQSILNFFYFQKKPLAQVAQLCEMNLATLRKAICRVRDVLRLCIVKTLSVSETEHD